MSSALQLDKLLNPQNRVTEEEMSLQRNGNSIYSYLMQQACQRENIDPADPGTAKQYYLRGAGVLVIDLRGDFDTTEGES